MHRVLEALHDACVAGLVERFCLTGAFAAKLRGMQAEDPVLDLLAIAPDSLRTRELGLFLSLRGAITRGSTMVLAGVPFRLEVASSHLARRVADSAETVLVAKVAVALPDAEHLAAWALNGGDFASLRLFREMKAGLALDPLRLGAICGGAGLGERLRVWSSAERISADCVEAPAGGRLDLLPPAEVPR